MKLERHFAKRTRTFARATLLLMLSLASAERAWSQPAAPTASRPAPTVSTPTTAPALLDAWRAAEKQRERFTLQYEYVCDGDGLYHHPRAAGLSGKRKLFSRGKVRYDGSRILFSRTESAESANKKLAKKPRLETSLWDGKVHYHYTARISVGVTVGRGSFSAHRLAPTAIPQGYLCDMNESVETVVRRSATPRLRSKPEVIDGFPCLVLEASGREGRQTLWIDTGRGYNVVKAEVHFNPGDLLNGNLVLNGYRFDATLSEVRLQQVNGIWFPTAFTYDYSQIFPDGHFRSHLQCTFSQIVVNPDFDALQAFVPVIEDGLRVRLAGDNSRKRYTWQKGEILDELGRKVKFR